MKELKNHTVKTWWIMKSIDNSVIHHGVAEVGQEVSSGQDELETFTVEQEWIDRLAVLGITIEE